MSLTPTLLPLLVFALAPSPSAELVEVRSWSAPPSCPSQAQLTAAVARRVEGKQSSAVVIEVVITDAAGGGYEADLILGGESGQTERHFDGETCEAVVDAISLITAINIAPDAQTGVLIEGRIAASGDDSGEREPDPEPDPEPSDPGPADSQTVTVVRKGNGPAVAPDDPVAVLDPAPTGEGETAAGPTPTRRPRGAASAAFVGGWGRLPVADLGPALSLRLVWRHARAEIDGVFYPAWTIDDPNTTARARIGMWTVALRGCGGPAWNRISVAVCGGLELGAARGEGLSAVVNRVATVPWVAFVAEPRFIWSPHPRIGVWASAVGYVALQRPGFRFEGSEFTHQSSIAGVDGRLGLEIYFP